MNCETVERELYRFLDEEMDPPTQGLLRQHLSGCASCAKKEVSLKAFRGLLKTPTVVPPLNLQFETIFWARANQLGTDSWIPHRIRKWEWVLPIPNVTQLAMMLFLAFMIGGAGAVVGYQWMGDRGTGLTAADSMRFLDTSSLSSAYWQMNGDFGQL